MAKPVREEAARVSDRSLLNVMAAQAATHDTVQIGTEQSHAARAPTLRRLSLGKNKHVLLKPVPEEAARQSGK